MVTELLHMSDTHIGYKQYHLREREQDFKDAFEQVIDAAIEHGVDGVVHSGDLFHQSRPSVRSLSFVIDNLKRLRDNNIGFYVIAGNHDGTREQQWPSLFENIGLATYLDERGAVVGDVALYGQDHVPPGKRDALSYTFDAADDATYTVFVGHGLFKPFPHGDWDLHRVLSKATVSFDVCLLGDDHAHRVESVNDSIATYAGSTERTAADQRAPRGYTLVSFTEDDVQVDHHDIQTREFVYVDVDMGDDGSVRTIRDELEHTTIPNGSVVIVTLTGGGERIPSATIEQSATVSPALTVKVNDRREFSDADIEYEEVSFSDPDDAARERKQELTLSRVGEELEELARDLEGVPDTHVKDSAESRTETALDEHGPDALTSKDPGGEPDDSAENDDNDDESGDGQQYDAGDTESPDGGSEQLTLGDTK